MQLSNWERGGWANELEFDLFRWKMLRFFVVDAGWCWELLVGFRRNRFIIVAAFSGNSN